MATFLVAQTPIDEAVRKADVAPAWPDCEPKLTDCTKSRMAEFIAANLQIPAAAKEQGAGGVVMMEFVVEKNGSVGEVKPVHDPGLGLGEEATRVINLMKTKKIKWTPAEENGKRVAYRYTVPVSFSLNLPKAPKTPPTTATVISSDQVLDIAEVMPRYAGCETATQDSVDCTFLKVLNHMKTNIKYPEEAMKNKVEGQVVTEFIIEANGSISNAVVKKGIGSGCDEEAIRVVNMMPAWIPGMQNGQAVRVKMTLPVVFQLSKK
jgi:TonB family protein